MSLRTRKRRVTLAAIYDHASRLVLANGFGNVTVEDICHAAGISRRTLFNYVDSKEAAVMGPPPRILTEQELDDFAHNRHVDIRRAIMRLVAASCGFYDESPDGTGKNSHDTAAMLLRRRRRIAIDNPTLTLQNISDQHEAYRSIIQAVTMYFENFPDEKVLVTYPAKIEAEVAVATTLAAVHLGLHQWMNSDEDSMESLIAAEHTAMEAVTHFVGLHGQRSLSEPDPESPLATSAESAE